MRDARSSNNRSQVAALLAMHRKPPLQGYDLTYNPNPRKSIPYSTYSDSYAQDVAKSGGGKRGQQTLHHHGLG